MRRLLLLIWLGTPVLLPQGRPGLFFREDWKEIPAALPVTQEHVANPDLSLNLHGPGGRGVRKSHHDKPADDPHYVWSGECPANWAVSLRHRRHFADLTGLAKIRWRSRQSGFRQLRVILKLRDGTWLVSDQFDDASGDWRVREFHLGDIRWRRLEVHNVVEGPWVERPDLTGVDEIGFTDLMRGGQSAACSRLDWIEVYGRPVKREPETEP